MNIFQAQLIINEEPMIYLHNRLAEGKLSKRRPAFKGCSDIFPDDPLGDYSILVGKFHNPNIRKTISTEEFLNTMKEINS